MPIVGYEWFTETEVAICDLIFGGVNSTTNNFSLKGIAFIYYADGMGRCNVVKNIGFGEPTVAAAA